MKSTTIIFSFLSLLLYSCNENVNINKSNEFSFKTDTIKPMENFEYSLKIAHANAQRLMNEDFYWSSIEETAPFGNDDGWDAAYSFHEWRLSHRDAKTIDFLNDLIKKWKYPYIDWNELDSSKIKEIINSGDILNEESIQERMKQMKEVFEKTGNVEMTKIDDEQLRQMIVSNSNQMNGIFLLGQDNAIIAIGFAQFVLE